MSDNHYINDISINEKRTEIYLHTQVTKVYFIIDLINKQLFLFNGKEKVIPKQYEIHKISNAISNFKNLIKSKELEFWVYSYLMMLLVCVQYVPRGYRCSHRYETLRRVFGKHDEFEWPKTVLTEYSGICEKLSKLGIYLDNKYLILATLNDTEDSIFNLDLNLKEYKRNPYGIVKGLHEYRVHEYDLGDYIRTQRVYLENNKLQSFFVNALDYFPEDQRNPLNLKKQLINSEIGALFNLNYEPKRLAKYIFSDLRWQGLKPLSFGWGGGFSECVSLLKDYAKMSSDILQSNKFDKYPSFLKSRHDIVMMNYKAKEDEIKNNKFKEVANKYMEYDGWKGKSKDYKIVVPTTPHELIVEGARQHHCVASYVDDVCEEKTFIVFVRYQDEEKKDQSIVTVEIKGNKINQAKRVNNESPLAEEKEFISNFCKNFNILYE